MRRVQCVLLAVLFLGSAAWTGAQSASPALAALQGRWIVAAAEHNARPLDAIKGGVMTVTGDAFEIRTASGNMLKGTLKLDASKQPAQMDLVHADGAKWEGIYEVTGPSFRLNYVEAGGKDPRPSAFSTSEKTEESLITLQREGR